MSSVKTFCPRSGRKPPNSGHFSRFGGFKNYFTRRTRSTPSIPDNCFITASEGL